VKLIGIEIMTEEEEGKKRREAGEGPVGTCWNKSPAKLFESTKEPVPQSVL
jgi:hypothetical protein